MGYYYFDYLGIIFGPVLICLLNLIFEIYKNFSKEKFESKMEEVKSKYLLNNNTDKYNKIF
jgi:hypothetical protein